MSTEQAIVDDQIVQTHVEEPALVGNPEAVQVPDPIESYDDPIFEDQVDRAAAEEAEYQALLAAEAQTDAPIVAQSAVEDPPEEPPVEDKPTESGNDSQETASSSADVIKFALAEIERLRSEIATLKAASSVSRTKSGIASGSKARPNVVYKLLKKPNAWHSTPQVAQLQQALFAPEVATRFTKDGAVTMTEPEIFSVIEAAAASGLLKTKQPPVRILQYYRSHLRAADCLGWS